MEVKLEELAKAISKALAEYSEEYAEAINKAAAEESKAAAKAIRSMSPKKTGEYSRGWTQKKTYAGRYENEHIVYNQKKHQITHLLEHGHTKRGGGRVAAIPHIKQAELQAIENFKRKVEEVANGKH